MSVATIVSIYPKLINEKKSSHMEPAEITIPACEKDGAAYPDFNPFTIPIYYAITSIYQMEGKWIRFPVPAYDYAKSIVDDFFRSNIEVVPDFESPVGPGIFAIDEAYARAEVIKENGYDVKSAAAWVKTNYASELKRAERGQDRWFQILVNRADADFSKNRNYRAISDLHRFAAKKLGIERDWTKDITLQAIFKCPACRLSIDPLSLICPNCKCVVKPEELKKLQE